MATPPFMLQIVDQDGVVIRTAAGGRHEVDFISSCVDKIMPLGVGVFKTSKHVEADIRQGIKDAIHAIKVKNPFDVEET